MKKKDVILRNEKGSPVSRIEIYASGANRVVSSYGQNLSPSNPPDRKECDIESFSSGARLRYFRYVNGLNLEGMFVYTLTATISSFVEKYLNVDSLRNVSKRFDKKIIRIGFDYVKKVEYTRKEVPHYHYIIYSKISLEDFKKKQNIDSLHDYFSSYFTNLIFDVVDLPPNFDTIHYLRMCHHAVRKIELVSNRIGLISYFAFYTSKRKDYQNIIPQKYLGLKCWQYGRENFGDLRQEPHHIALTHAEYGYIFQIMSDIYFQRTGRTIFYKNGFHLDDTTILKNGLTFFQTVIEYVLNNQNKFNQKDFEKFIKEL